MGKGSTDPSVTHVHCHGPCLWLFNAGGWWSSAVTNRPGLQNNASSLSIRDYRWGGFVGIWEKQDNAIGLLLRWAGGARSKLCCMLGNQGWKATGRLRTAITVGGTMQNARGCRPPPCQPMSDERRFEERHCRVPLCVLSESSRARTLCTMYFMSIPYTSRTSSLPY